MIDFSNIKSSLEGKPIAIFGLGLSGLSCVNALVKSGIQVCAWDDSDDNIEKSKALGAETKNLTEIDLSDFAFLVLSPGVPYTFNPHKVVQNAQQYNLEIIGDVELLARNGLKTKTIGITGTNGKSTTTALMTHVLRDNGLKAVMGGNIGKAVCDLDLTDIDYLVLELSSYQLDLCPSFRPDISMLLNITPDHLDRHGSMKAYVAAKGRILKDDGTGVIGVDDDFSSKLFHDNFCAGQRTLTPISVKQEIPEGLFVKNDTLYHNHLGENKEIGRLDNFDTLKGLHNYQNMACVYHVAKQCGLTDNQIFQSFKSFAGLPHRQYKVAEKNDVTYINDSKATNAEAAAKALSSYDNIFWIVGGRAKEGGLEGLEIFKDKVKKTYVIGECAQEFGHWLFANGFGFEINQTLDVATNKAHEDALNFTQESKGKAVVLLSPATASWDQFKSFETRGDAFMELVQFLTQGSAS